MIANASTPSEIEPASANLSDRVPVLFWWVLMLWRMSGRMSGKINFSD
jgi:hypothetical protein